MGLEDAQSDSLSETLAVFDRRGDAHEPLTASEVSEALSCTRRTAYDRLTRLADRGVVETKKVGARGRVWWRESRAPETGAESPNEGGESDSLLLDVLDGTDAGVFVLNDEFEVVWANDGVERYFGLDPTAVVGRDKRRLLDEAILDAVANPDAFAEAVLSAYDDDTSAETFECRVTAGEHRTERWLEHRSRPIESGRFAGGRVELYYDVTESKRHRLTRSRAALEREPDEVFERIDDAVFALDDDDRFTYLNRRAERLLDCDASDAVGRSLTDVCPLDGDSAAYDAVRRASETQSSVTYEEYSESYDRWLEGRVYPSETGVSVCVRNVDERKRRERQRERERERYETIFETIDDAVCVFDEDGRLVASNAAFETLTGYSVEEFLGETPAALVSEETVENVLERCRDEFRRGKEVVSVETEAVAKDGERVGIEARITRYHPSEDSHRWIAVVRDVTEKKEELRRYEHQQERLTALNSVNAVVREISDAVISRPTREEIEREVCEAFAESESYRFAWIAGIDPRRGKLTPRVEVGVEGYVDEIDLTEARSLNTLDESGPASRAVRTGEIQVVNDAFSDEDFEPWRHLARKYDYRSVAAVPIEYEGTTYGLLGVYADRENAFEEEERRALGPVGEIVGHAIAANERKQALMGDEAVEVEFRVPNLFGEFGATLPSDGVFRIDRTVPLDDGTYLEYGVASADVLDVLESLVDEIPHWRSLATFERDSSTDRFELYLSEQPVQSAVASLGGYVESAGMADGDFELTVHLSVSTDVRRVIENVRETYPDAELVARRLVSVEGAFRERLQRVFADTLTERQRNAVETAYYSGFFEWPRESTGETVAESLGVSAPTFHQHLRRAEKELFGQLLAERPVTDP